MRLFPFSTLKFVKGYNMLDNPVRKDGVVTWKQREVDAERKREQHVKPSVFKYKHLWFHDVEHVNLTATTSSSRVEARKENLAKLQNTRPLICTYLTFDVDVLLIASKLMLLHRCLDDKKQRIYNLCTGRANREGVLIVQAWWAWGRAKREGVLLSSKGAYQQE